MFSKFFDIDDLVHQEFVPPGQCVNGNLYLQTLQRLQDAVGRKWQEQWILFPDNAPNHNPVISQPWRTSN
jgi:hypothetical protein